MSEIADWVRCSTAQQGTNEKAQDQEAILGLVGLIRTLRLRPPNSRKLFEGRTSNPAIRGLLDDQDELQSDLPIAG